MNNSFNELKTAGERIIELEDSSIELLKLKHKEKKSMKNETAQSIQELWDNIKLSYTYL